MAETKGGGQVWLGPLITDPEDPTLALSVQYERIIRRDGHYVMEDPGITLNRFGWDEDAAEGMTWRHADGTRIALEEDDDDTEPRADPGSLRGRQVVIKERSL